CRTGTANSRDSTNGVAGRRNGETSNGAATRAGAGERGRRGAEGEGDGSSRIAVELCRDGADGETGNVTGVGPAPVDDAGAVEDTACAGAQDLAHCGATARDGRGRAMRGGVRRGRQSGRSNAVDHDNRRGDATLSRRDVG